MFEVQADLECHLQKHQDQPPHRPRLLKSQHVLDPPWIARSRPRTFSSILLYHHQQLKSSKPTKANKIQASRLSTRILFANILHFRPTPSLEHHQPCSFHHQPPFLPPTKIAGKKVATNVNDSKFGLASQFPNDLSCRLGLYASSKEVLGHRWGFLSSYFMYLLCL